MVPPAVTFPANNKNTCLQEIQKAEEESLNKILKMERLIHIPLAQESGGQILLQSLFLMLYAQWQGFLKESVGSFLRFLEAQDLCARGSNHRILVGDLAPNFILKLEPKDFLRQNSKKLLAETTLDRLDGVGNKGNVTPENLKEIAWVLGIDLHNMPFLISLKVLTDRRNKIAHGDFSDELKVDDFPAEKTREAISQIAQKMQESVEEGKFRVSQIRNGCESR